MLFNYLDESPRRLDEARPDLPREPPEGRRLTSTGLDCYHTGVLAVSLSSPIIHSTVSLFVYVCVLFDGF